jgi:D-alanine-D-alanine ligase
MSKIRVAVLMGGVSSEREVSLVSGREVMRNLDKEKYEVRGIDVPRELDKLGRPEVAFLALHGKGGEDGAIQGYLETLGIKYTGCRVLASAVGMNKMIFRKLMEREKLPMARLTQQSPCVVKPVNGGSSVGVSIVRKQEDLEKAINLAKKYGEVMIEEYIEGREVSCGILGDQVLPVVEIVPKKEFFDYEAKYQEGMSEEICPAEIDKKVTQLVQKLSMEVFKAIGGRGYARVDFIIRKNRPYILEINTLPGLTPNSLLPKEAKVAGLSYSQVLDRIIKLAIDGTI